jgi:hypothetical protein
MSAEVTYKTHILIGVRENGVMTVIADWPHVPKQSEVQRRIDDARNGYVSFMLCTPPSLMPAHGNGVTSMADCLPIDHPRVRSALARPAQQHQGCLNPTPRVGILRFASPLMRRGFLRGLGNGLRALRFVELPCDGLNVRHLHLVLLEL